MKRIHEDAVVTREMFISDIAQVLSESRNMKSLRIKTKELQRKLHLAESYESDLKEARRQLKEYQKGNLDQLAITTTPSSSSIAIPATKKKTKKFLIHLGDQMLLEIFSFLETQDVLRAAQVCRFVFKRVDTLFGIESQIAKAEWAVEPPDFELDPPSPVVVSPAPVPQMTGTPNPPPAPLGLTKSVADALLKKLSRLSHDSPRSLFFHSI